MTGTFGSPMTLPDVRQLPAMAQSRWSGIPLSWIADLGAPGPEPGRSHVGRAATPDRRQGGSDRLDRWFRLRLTLTLGSHVAGQSQAHGSQAQGDHGADRRGQLQALGESGAGRIHEVAAELVRE